MSRLTTVLRIVYGWVSESTQATTTSDPATDPEYVGEEVEVILYGEHFDWGLFMRLQKQEEVVQRQLRKTLGSEVYSSYKSAQGEPTYHFLWADEYGH